MWAWWLLLGAAVLAASGVLGPAIVDALTTRREAREAFHDVVEARPHSGPVVGNPVAGLLDPHIAVVPFAGRESELRRLTSWCVDDQTGRIRLVTGGGGVGKTRLALQLVQKLTDLGWRCEWVRDGREADAVQAARRVTRGNVLLIVDYAEIRQGLAEMLHAVAAATGRTLRVLLLARHAGDWWQRLAASEPVVRAMVRDADRLIEELPAATQAELADLDVARQAMPFFAAKLNFDSPNPERLVLTGEPPIVRVLDLHAAALIAVLAASDVPTDTALRIDLTKVLEDLLSHEKRYWLGHAEALDLLSGPQGLTSAQLSQIVAAACLLGAPTQDDALEMLGRVPHVSPSGKLADWIRDLYPPGPGEGWLGALHPDRLAELHVTSELDRSPELAHACLTDLDNRQASRALVLLARASDEHQTAQQHLLPLLYESPAIIAEVQGAPDTMIAIANAIPSPSIVLGEAHAALVARIVAAHLPGTAERAIWLHSYGVLLSGLGKHDQALTAIEEAIAIRDEQARNDPETSLPDLASSLNSRSDLLRLLGQRAEALAAAEEAVAICRRLAETDPALFLSEVAGSLNNLANSLSELGRREDALAAMTEAVGIHRDLFSKQPEAFRSDLAMSLNNQAGRSWEAGRPEEALATITEAVALRRQLASAWPDAFLPDLALSLVNQSVYLGALQRRGEALTAVQAAADIFRGLAHAHPDAYMGELATALNNEAGSLADLGQLEEATNLIREAVTKGRELAEGHPDAFLPGLAMSLNNMARRLTDIGQLEQALDAAEEAVAIYRDLAQAHPNAFRPQLSTSLATRSDCLSELGRRKEALSSAEEAVAICRELAQAYPEAFLPDLASLLDSQSTRLWDLGRPGEALIVGEKAVDIYRQLLEAHPGVFLPDLANSLNTYANYLSDRGRLDEALAAIEESVAICRELADGHPDAFQPDLARSVLTHSNCLAAADRWEDALAASEEAVGIYRALIQAHPDSFLRPLTAALHNHALHLSHLGHVEEALRVTEETVAIRRQLSATNPDAFLPDLALSLNNYANRLIELKRWDEARAAAEEAVAIRRQLAAALPAAFLPNLATSLHNLAVILRELGRNSDAESAEAEVMEIVSRAQNMAGQPVDENALSKSVPPNIAELAQHLDSIMSQAEVGERLAAARAAAPDWLVEYFDSATRAAASQWMAAEADGLVATPIPPHGWPEWLRIKILETLMAWGTGVGATCMHAPSQTRPEPVFAAAWKPGLVVCPKCTHLLSVPGGKGSREDNTCDGCGHVAKGTGDDVIRWAAVPVGPLTYALGVCSSCFQTLEA
jgi:tetratricopeptide (TPR) repeat protein